MVDEVAVEVDVAAPHGVPEREVLRVEPTLPSVMTGLSLSSRQWMPSGDPNGQSPFASLPTALYRASALQAGFVSFNGAKL